MDLLLAFYQRVASSPFHDLNAIFVTDSLGPFALFSVSFHSQTKPFSFYPRTLHSSSAISRSKELILLSSLSAITKLCPSVFYKLSHFPKTLVSVSPTSLHDAELDLPDESINIRWVLHLTGVCPIVIKLQLPEEDGDIIPLRVPIPDHSVLETPTHGFEGIHMVVENLERSHDQRVYSVPGQRDWDSRSRRETPSSAQAVGLIPGQGAEFPRALWPKYQNNKAETILEHIQ